jgi:diguanylate cyclase (GGDEF)-like protein
MGPEARASVRCAQHISPKGTPEWNVVLDQFEEQVYRLRGTRALGLFLLLLGWQAAAGAQPQVLTKAAEVHDLPAATARMSVPVHLIATVTYYDSGEHTLFVADTSGAVFVQTSHRYPLHRGDLVQIDGVTAKSYRTVVGPDPKIVVLGRGPLPRAKVGSYPRYQDLMSGRWDCQFVMLHGVVRSAVVEEHESGRILELEVLLLGGVVQAYVQDYRGIDLGRLIDAEVTISGVVAGEYNARWDLMRSVIYGGDAGDLKIVREPRTQPLQLPATAAGDIMQTHAVEDESQRVRVRGTVIYYRPGVSVVVKQADGQSVSAHTRQADGTALGAIVDLVGFASEGGYGPELAETEIFPTGQFARISPTPVSYAQAMAGTFNDNLVSVRGRVESELHADASDTLFLRVDDHAVTIVLQTRESSERLPDLPVGTLVAVSGICRITPTAVWGTPGATPMLFRLDMRTRNDLQVLRWPSWWTVQHLLFVLGVLLAMALTITAWALVLRRRVERTMRLEQERSRLLEAINSETPLEKLLEGILASAATLAGGLGCCCTVLDATGEGRDANRRICLGEPPAEVRFEASLTDSKGRHIGVFQAGGWKGRELSKYEREVMEVGTGLANLAVNQRRMYQELNYTSTHDQLTALPNRRLSDVTLELALQKAAGSGVRIGVAYIDVDRFKQVNDQHGHKVGDLYLQQIAERLMAQVRAEDKLARIGGDEFLLIATGLNSVADAEVYRCRLERCFESGFVLEGARVYGSASIGIAVFPDHGATAEELKRHADIDMYSVKHGRRAELELRSSKSGETDIYSPADLEAAMEIEQFRVFYQPQFSTKGQLRGVEALIRLEDPILGIVTPDAFIGVAERHDLILPLGAWVLRKALADAAMWQLERMPGVRMVVNVAARQLEHPRFADDVAAALERAGLPPSSLELEITERTIARDVEEAMRQLQQLHRAGVSISIDDFGTGHSCLSALHKLPVDTLKIDRSFVHAMESEPEVLHVIEAIVALARTMQKRVVAEGVETREDVEGLLQLGEMDLQGFYFGPPQPSEEFASSLRAWRGGVAIL